MQGINGKGQHSHPVTRRKKDTIQKATFVTKKHSSVKSCKQRIINKKTRVINRWWGLANKIKANWLTWTWSKDVKARERPWVFKIGKLDIQIKTWRSFEKSWVKCVDDFLAK